MQKFQTILIGFFAGVAIIAVLMFAGLIPGFKNKGGTENAVNLSLWGTFDKSQMRPLIASLNEKNKTKFAVKYESKNADSYASDIVNALAAGKGPDMWIIKQDAVLKNLDKVIILPFNSFSERSFRDAFADSAEVYLFFGGGKRRSSDLPSVEGTVALPIAIDPIVLYWNKDLFSSAGVARPPEYWDEFLDNVVSLTKRDEAGNIVRAGTALGEFGNIKNAKDILSMLFLQLGEKIVDPVSLKVVLGEKNKNAVINPAENAILFFTEFSNPKKSSYTWNRALPVSDDMFAAGSLAMYFGYASELEEMRAKNPHLNFDIAPVPQVRDGNVRATFGKVYAVAASKSSRNARSVFPAMFAMAMDDGFGESFSRAFFLAPARRDPLAAGSEDPYFSIIYKSAIMAKTWLEPDAGEIYKIFKNMVESTATGKVRVAEAVRGANKQMERLLKSK